MSDGRVDAKVRWLVGSAQRQDRLAQNMRRKYYADARETAFMLRVMARDGLERPGVIAGVPEANRSDEKDYGEIGE